MKHAETLQAALDYIDANITREMTAAQVAEAAGYSVYHFSRMFSRVTGTSLMSYVTWRRLQHALGDLARGDRVLDVALNYGFETHAGFTKAFVNRYGFPPSLCRLRLSADPPARMTVDMLTNRFKGENEMHPHIIELTPFSVVGYPSRHVMPSLKSTKDAPLFWSKIGMDYGPMLEKLHGTFTKSKHFEVSMCYGADDATGEFTYMLGRGIDASGDLEKIEPDMTRVDIPGGLYAIFSTPPAEDFAEPAIKMWNDILTSWLPQSEFEYDDSRPDFEYHDYRDHGWYFGGNLQIDICIPIRQKDDERRKARLGANYLG